MSALVAQLQTLLGTSQVLTGADAAPYCTDWRRRYHGQALCVARPADTAEVALVVKACAAAGVPVVPQGGNTGLVGGGTPDADGRSVVLSLQRLHKVREIDAANQTLTAEAGCVLQAVQQAAADADWLFPLSMGSEGSCTLGGNLATNAGGTQVLRYGNARELCLGLEVVTPQGEVYSELHGLRKNNTGYDLRHLFIGSEGTLGIITAATLKIFPQPRGMVTAWAAVDSAEHAVALLALARQHLGASLTGFEWMTHDALHLVHRHFPDMAVPLYKNTPCCVLLELSDAENEAHGRLQIENLLQAALDGQLITDAIVAENLTQARTLWHIRESIPLAQAQDGLNVKHDISLPISAIAQYVAETNAAVQQAVPGARIVNFGHLGDGNLHYNVQAPIGQAPADFLAACEAPLNQIIFDNVARLGGSISAEHGIGQLKRDTLPKYKSPVALQMMRAIKRALDPHNTMNPGRLISIK